MAALHWAPGTKLAQSSTGDFDVTLPAFIFKLDSLDCHSIGVGIEIGHSLGPRVLLAQFRNSGSQVTPRSSVMASNLVAPGDLCDMDGSPPS